MILKTIIFLIIFSLLVRFVLRFLIPISQMTRMTQKRLNDIKNQMEAVNNQANKMNKTKRVEEEYIDYEEVK